MTDWGSAVIRVGDGRGFVIEGEQKTRYVITAAHCLPHLPPCCSFSYLEERTYQKLLALRGGERTVWAECLFADPVSDIAVLGEPDNQELSEQCDAYRELTQSVVTPLPVAEPGKEAWLLSLEGGVWFRCGVRSPSRRWLMFADLAGEFAGMSGSPVVSADGAAIGVACLGGEDGAGNPTAWQGPNPSLVGNLPGWLLAELA
jgi:hypothetical protein